MFVITRDGFGPGGKGPGFYSEKTSKDGNWVPDRADAKQFSEADAKDKAREIRGEVEPA